MFLIYLFNFLILFNKHFKNLKILFKEFEFIPRFKKIQSD